MQKKHESLEMVSAGEWEGDVVIRKAKGLGRVWERREC